MTNPDQVLREAGERWRARQEPPAVEMPGAAKDGQLRRRRLGVVVAAVVVVALVVAGSAVLIGSDGDSPTVGTRRQRYEPPPLNAELLTRLLLPASTDDKRESEKLTAFEGAVSTSAASECVVDRGYGPWLDPGHLALLPKDSHRRYFEEPASLRSSGLTGAGAPLNLPPEAAIDPRPDAPAEVIEACLTQGQAKTAPLDSMIPILMDWDATVEMLESSAQLRPAQDAWVACMNALGWNVESEEQFYRGSDRTKYEAGSAEAIQTDDLAAGADYATCLEQGLYDARVQVRTAARADFIAAHDLLFERALRDLPRAIRSLSTRYQIDGLSDLWQPTAESQLATWIAGLGQTDASATRPESDIEGCPWLTEGDIKNIWNTITTRSFAGGSVMGEWDDTSQMGTCTGGWSRPLDITVSIVTPGELDRALRKADEQHRRSPAVRVVQTATSTYETSAVIQAEADVVVTLTMTGSMTVSKDRIRDAAQQVVERLRARGPTDPTPGA